MAITFDELKALVTAEGLKYFVDPENSRLMMGVTGMCGRYQLVMSLYEGGAFLQFRSMNYLSCPAAHPSLPAVLKALADINFQARLVKMAWDQNDGEVVAYADIWIMDSTFTRAQLNRMMNNYVPVIDTQHTRLEQALKEGKDPGRVDPATLMSRLLGDPSLPPELRDLLAGKKPAAPDSL